VGCIPGGGGPVKMRGVAGCDRVAAGVTESAEDGSMAGVWKMQSAVRWLLCSVVLLLLVSGVGGCHNLQSHRLRRWNYNDSGSRGDALWSVGDVLRSGSGDTGPAYRPEVPSVPDQAAEQPEAGEDL
jgi:hypothetical protein